MPSNLFPNTHPPANVVAIDTTSDYLSLALQKNGIPVGNHYSLCGRKTNQWLFQELHTLLEGAQMTPGELDLVVVAAGPGSFTGTRMGMGAALSFGQVLGVPVIGVDTLCLLAGQTQPTEGLFHALLHCTRDEVYQAAYRWQGEELIPAGNIQMELIENLGDLIGQEPVVWRSLFPDMLSPDQTGILNGFPQRALRHPFPDGLRLLEAGLARWHSRKGPIPPPRPIYLKSEAIRKWTP
ncbi:MAG: tRNA (adenosine(37)-N6)-threonylcarbamoyltransferase complex dimerization subunit type 1 TsaB [Deltaproteobacteria bacterium]|nr:tRNA (adenosine(37)-N6)-threonylcarbamoyltransferase complex dimerization subunit type 1 TsaB [Deltaproteobacteria bacterium]